MWEAYPFSTSDSFCFIALNHWAVQFHTIRYLIIYNQVSMKHFILRKSGYIHTLQISSACFALKGNIQKIKSTTFQAFSSQLCGILCVFNRFCENKHIVYGDFFKKNQK